MISGELDYWEESVQNEIENLTRTFEQSPYVSSSSFFTESWLRSFKGYVDRNRDTMNISIDTKENFMKTLKEVKYTFIILVIFFRVLHLYYHINYYMKNTTDKILYTILIYVYDEYLHLIGRHNI